MEEEKTTEIYNNIIEKIENDNTRLGWSTREQYSYYLGCIETYEKIGMINTEEKTKLIMEIIDIIL